jgi:hypothetical protein
MKKPAGWNESGDEMIVDWKRVRSQIEHEDMLINHRMSWFLAASAFLFSAFCISLSSLKKDTPTETALLLGVVLTAIPVVGVILSIIAWRVLDDALVQVTRLKNWWSNRLKGEAKEEPPEPPPIPEHPPIIGEQRFPFLHRFLVGWLIPSVLAVTWITLVIIYQQNYFLKVIPSILKPALIALAIVLAFGFGSYRASRKK